MMKTINCFLLAALPSACLARSVEASALLKPTSGVTQALSPKTLAIESSLRGAFAQTTVTTVYANPNNSRMEADFLYSAPKGSVVTGFSYWYQGEKVVARVVEKARAAKIYHYITSRMRDPALIEMVGPNKFRARIFPIEARTDLKIEVRLAQTLSATPGGQSWNWPLRDETSEGALQNVKVHIHSDRAFESNLGATTNNDLKFERPNYKATTDARALVRQNAAPLRASLVAAREGGPDGFFTLALTSNSPLASPRFKISGVSTYDVLVPTMRRLGAGENFVVMGRYHGGGTALVSLNGRSVQVNFSGAREAVPVSSKLWASARIESLSNRPSNQRAVMALSKRFGIPSKWTSWLAIPSEERRTFKRQMLATDRAEAAKAYAQAVSRGDKNAMRAQKAAFDSLSKNLESDGPNYAASEELQPLDSYLNDELRQVQSAQLEAKYDATISKSQRAQWAQWALYTRNLRKAGASDKGAGVDLPVYLIEDELRIASRLYLQEIEAGRKDGAGARKLQGRLKELAGTKTAKQYGWNDTMFMGEQAEMRANALAMDIATNRASDSPDLKREAQSKARLARLNGEGRVNSEGALQSALQQVWGQKIEGVAQKWAIEIKAGRAEGEAGKGYEAEVVALQKRSGLRDLPQIREAWSGFAWELRDQIAAEVAAKRDAGPKIQNLRTALARIEKGHPDAARRPDDWGHYSERFAWEGRAHEAAYRLLETQKSAGSDPAKQAAIGRELDKSVQKGSKNRDEVVAYEKTRLAKNEPLITADFYRLRSGDPLISVLAPATCQSVVAQMPDGSLLPLRFNELNHSWEARFDVPTFASDGAYRVQIFIIGPDGVRRHLTMNFAVDSSAPTGTGKVQSDGKTWHLSLQSDEQTDRVSALLPWQERVELRRDESAAFVADVSVPPEFQGKKSQVRFLLTDGAHNRTEVALDWN